MAKIPTPYYLIAICVAGFSSVLFLGRTIFKTPSAYSAEILSLLTFSGSAKAPVNHSSILILPGKAMKKVNKMLSMELPCVDASPGYLRF